MKQKYKITYYAGSVSTEKIVTVNSQAELRAEIEKLPPGSVRKLEFLG